MLDGLQSTLAALFQRSRWHKASGAERSVKGHGGLAAAAGPGPLPAVTKAVAEEVLGLSSLSSEAKGFSGTLTKGGKG